MSASGGPSTITVAEAGYGIADCARTPSLSSHGDALGPEFALLRFDRSVCISGLVDAAARCGLPVAVLDIEAPEALYARNLVLVRPDQHVAWRADAEAVTCINLIDRVRGALATKTHKAA